MVSLSALTASALLAGGTAFSANSDRGTEPSVKKNGSANSPALNSTPTQHDLKRARGLAYTSITTPNNPVKPAISRRLSRGHSVQGAAPVRAKHQEQRHQRHAAHADHPGNDPLRRNRLELGGIGGLAVADSQLLAGLRPHRQRHPLEAVQFRILAFARVEFLAAHDDLIVDPEAVFAAAALDGPSPQVFAYLEALAARWAADQQQRVVWIRKRHLGEATLDGNPANCNPKRRPSSQLVLNPPADGGR